MSIDFIQRANSIFWDFDGVIKDSVEVKSDAFERLFLPYGKDIAKKVRKHHEENGGMSRYDKLPIYLNWIGKTPSTKLITEYANSFSKLVKNEVVDSLWVTGVLDYLHNNDKKQDFFLITATPQEEIEEILSQLKVSKYFKQVVGFPTGKAEAIKILLNKYNINPGQSVMIGDSNSDYEAAIYNQIAFVLRKTKLNKKLQGQLTCLKIKNFMEF